MVGKQRKISFDLSQLLPKADQYFEPFVGSGAMLRSDQARRGIAGDVIPELIQLWIIIRDKPDLTAQEYELVGNDYKKKAIPLIMKYVTHSI
jgi:DNA adenine methylase